MSFGWSVGDLIAGINVIVKISHALSSSTGSAKKFKDVITQLRQFENLLRWVRQFAQTLTDEEDQAAFLPIVDAGRDVIDGMLDRLDGYQKHLGPATKLHKIRVTDAISKVKFHFFVEKDIVEWKITLASSSLNVLAMLIIHDARRNRLNEIDKDLYKIVESLQVDLKKVLTELSTNSENIALMGASFPTLNTMQTTSTDILEQITDLKRENKILVIAQESTNDQLGQLTRLNDQHLETIKDLRNLISTNQQELALRALPRAQTFIFEDALGYIAHLDLTWVDCYETLHEHLLIRFRSRPGTEMVRKKQYILNDAFTGARYDLKDAHGEFFRPGQVINMSMCFCVEGQVLAACPRCGEGVTEAANGEITCMNTLCSISFRRVEEVEVTEIPSVQANPNPKAMSSGIEFLEFRRLCILPDSTPSEIVKEKFRSQNVQNANEFSSMLDQWISSSGEIALWEKFKDEKVAAFPNPLEELGNGDFSLEDREEEKASAFWTPLGLWAPRKGPKKRRNL